MLDLVTSQNVIPSMTEIEINSVRQLEEYTLKAQQIEISTHHIFHAGVYARTITIPAGAILTGALIKIATVLISHGDCIVYIGNEAKELHGYNIFAASRNRKQAFIAKTDTNLTMIFATDAKTTEEAEEQFTEDYSFLSSRRADAVNNVIITGE